MPPSVTPPAPVGAPAPAISATAPFKIGDSPGEGSIGQPITMDSPDDRKMNHRDIATVMPKDEPFGRVPPCLIAFINPVRQHGRNYGWDGSNAETLQIQLMVQGEWYAPSAEDVKPMAMQAKIDTLTRGQKGGGESTAKTEGRRNTNKRPGAKPDPDWLVNDTKPDPIDEVLVHKGKSWHFCCQENGGKCNGKWRVHKPIECTGLVGKKRGKEKQKGRSNTEGGGDGGSHDRGSADDGKRMKRDAMIGVQPE
jgi:hypothetical protein